MNETKLATLEQIREFLAGTLDVTFTISANDAQLRAFVGTAIGRTGYVEMGLPRQPGLLRISYSRSP